jgi:ubiquinol-cytochrome c reductase cytochrome b subunit
MPAYGKNLNPAEVTSLVTFLETMHPPNIAPARQSQEPAVPSVIQRSRAPSP